MKAKRLVSVLLAAMLLIGMIPMNAFAAEQDCVEFVLSIGDSFGGTVTSEADATKSITIPTAFPANKNKYKQLADNDDYATAFKKSAAADTDLSNNVKTAEKFFTPDSDGKLTGKAAGDVVYLGVKAKLKNPSGTYKGIFNYTVYIGYDKRQFEPADTTAEAGLNGAGGKYRNMVIPNAVYVTNVNKNAGFSEDTGELDPTQVGLVYKYHSDCAFGSANEIGKSSDENTQYLAVGGKSTNTFCYFPTETTWDYIVPMKVKAGAKGTGTFSVVIKTSPAAGQTAQPTEIQLSTQEYDGMTAVTDGSTLAISQNQGNDSKISSNTVSVEIVSNDASMELTAASVPDGGEADVVVTATNATINASADGTNWTAVETTTGSGASATVSKVTPDSTDAHKATVHLTGITKGSGDGKITLKATKAAFTADAGKTVPDDGLSAAGITVVPVPNASCVTLESNGTYKVTATGGAMKYSLDGGENWLPTTPIAENANATIADADLRKALTGTPTTASGINTYDDVIWIAFSDAAQKGSTAVTKVDVKEHVAPTDATKAPVNYADNTVTPASGYGVCATEKGTYQTTQLSVSGSFYYRKEGDAQGIASAGTKVTLESGKKIVADNTTDWAQKIEGNTTVSAKSSGLATGEVTISATTKYKVDTSSASAPADWSTISDTIGGTSKNIAATAGQKIFLHNDGSISGPGADGEVTGVGYAAPVADDIAITPPTAVSGNGAKVVLTITDAEAQFQGTASSATSITVKDGSTTVATCSVALTSDSSKTGTSQTIATITNSADWDKTKTYTVEIGTTGIKPTPASTLTKTFKVNEKAYKLVSSDNALSLAGQTVTDVTYTPGSAKDTVTIGSIPAGKEVKSVTVPTGKGTVGANIVNNSDNTATFEYTAPATKESEGVEDVTVTITLGDIQYTKLGYADAEFAFGDAVTVSPKSTGGFAVDARAGELEITDVTPSEKTEFTIDKDTGVITVATPANLKSNTTYTVTVASKTVSSYTATATIKIGKQGIKPTIKAREYDGTDTVYSEDVTGWTPASTTATLTGAKYASSAVGTHNITGGTMTGADDYTLSLTGVQGQITAATVASATVKDVNVSKPADAAAIATAIANSDVEVTNGNGRKITEKVSTFKSASDITPLVEAALRTAGATKSNEQTYEAGSASTPTIAAISKTDTLKPKNAPAGATFALSGNNVAHYSIDAATGIVTVGNDAADGDTFTVTSTDGEGNTIATQFTITKVNEATIDMKEAQGKSFTIDLGTVTGSGNYSGSITLPSALKTTVKKIGGSTGGGGSSSSIVNVDENGFGTTDISSVDVDESGKIVNLPTISNVVKGAEFIGWSVDGNPNHIIDPETYVVPEGTEVTLKAIYRGYMAGYEDNTAKPTKVTTRAELLKLLLTAAGIYDSSEDYGDPTFTDAKNKWYSNYIACAQQSDLDIVAGFGDGTFRPNDPVTREQAARMIAETFGVTTIDGETTDKFTDMDEVSGWAQKYIAALTANGTISGYTDGTVKGGKNVRRNEAAVMINKYLGLTDEAKAEIAASSIDSPFTDMKNAGAWDYVDIMFASLSVPASYYSTEIVIPEAE